MLFIKAYKKYSLKVLALICLQWYCSLLLLLYFSRVQFNFKNLRYCIALTLYKNKFYQLYLTLLKV